MEARASAKYLRGSAQKARLVIDMIRGKKVGNALGILRFANKRAAGGIEKCLLSAIANAKEAGEKANVIVDEDATAAEDATLRADTGADAKFDAKPVIVDASRADAADAKTDH